MQSEVFFFLGLAQDFNSYLPFTCTESFSNGNWNMMTFNSKCLRGEKAYVVYSHINHLL